MVWSGAFSIEHNQFDILGWLEGLHIKEARRHEKLRCIARALWMALDAILYPKGDQVDIATWLS
jgi:hypothetical protein